MLLSNLFLVFLFVFDFFVVLFGWFIFELSAKDIDDQCESDEKVVVQGIADCIVFENDGITVVDFKTDRNVTEEELVHRYTKQLQLYAQAFSANYNQPVKDCLIYSFWLKKVVKVTVWQVFKKNSKKLLQLSL